MSAVELLSRVGNAAGMNDSPSSAKGYSAVRVGESARGVALTMTHLPAGSRKKGGKTTAATPGTSLTLTLVAVTAECPDDPLRTRVRTTYSPGGSESVP